MAEIDLATRLSEILEPAMRSLQTRFEMYDIFGLVGEEFFRARELHGDQTDRRDLGMGPELSYLEDLNDHSRLRLWAQDNGDAANTAKALCQDPERESTWADIAGEEFFEMLAEDDPEKIETEAIQTIAMLVNVVMAARKVKAASE